MSEQETRTFKAADAIAYADAYRRWSLEQPAALTAAHKRLEEEIFGMGLVPARSWAELRAIEHALEYKLERKDPGLVVIGAEAPADATEETMSPQLRKALDDNGHLEEENKLLSRQLRIAKEQQQELQAEVVRREQQTARLERKLSQAYASFTISGVTGTIVLLILFALLFLRN